MSCPRTRGLEEAGIEPGTLRLVDSFNEKGQAVTPSATNLWTDYLANSSVQLSVGLSVILFKYVNICYGLVKLKWWPHQRHVRLKSNWKKYSGQLLTFILSWYRTQHALWLGLTLVTCIHQVSHTKKFIQRNTSSTSFKPVHIDQVGQTATSLSQNPMLYARQIIVSVNRFCYDIHMSGIKWHNHSILVFTQTVKHNLEGRAVNSEFNGVRSVAYPVIFGFTSDFSISRSWLTLKWGRSPWQPVLHFRSRSDNPIGHTAVHVCKIVPGTKVLSTIKWHVTRSWKCCSLDVSGITQPNNN